MLRPYATSCLLHRLHDEDIKVRTGPGRHVWESAHGNRWRDAIHRDRDRSAAEGAGEDGRAEPVLHVTDFVSLPDWHHTSEVDAHAGPVAPVIDYDHRTTRFVRARPHEN